MAAGIVDAAVCVTRSERPDRLFDFRLIRNLEEVVLCKKSRYYPVEVSHVIPQIKKFSGKVAFIGLPCFVKGMHYAMGADPTLRERIAYLIGLFCGHLKTRQYAAYLSRCCGVHERDVITVDFRKKVPGQPAGDYAFEVIAKVKGREVRRETPMRRVYASNWSLNLFMHDACDCCDDVMAETADVAVGDAWLPQYVADHRGTSVIVCRQQEILERLRAGVHRGEVCLEELAADDVIRSQVGCLRHRRQGLAYRLYLARRRGQWRPRKRVEPDRWSLPLFNRIIQRLRMRIKRASREAFRMQQPRDGIGLFVRRVRAWVWLHGILYWGRGIFVGIRRRLSLVPGADRSGGATGETK